VARHRNFLYPPARAITVSLETYEERQQNKRLLTIGIDKIDARVNPPVPGDLVIVEGRPGMGKTLLLVYLAKQASQALTAQNAPTKEVVLYVTWETRVEEFVGLISAGLSGYSLSDIGRGKADLVKVKHAAAQLLNDRILVVGRSHANTQDGDFTLLDLERIVQELVADGFTIAAIFVDYLQEIPPLQPVRMLSESNKVLYVSENLRYCKRLGMVYGARMYVAVQARREVDQQEGLQWPGLNDGQWTSAIEQVADKVFAITIPAKYYKAGSELKNIDGYNYEVTAMTLCMRLLKQRWGVADTTDMWVLAFHPVLLRLSEQSPIGVYTDDDEAF
jgi:replicative DNA helicase